MNDYTVHFMCNKSRADITFYGDNKVTEAVARALHASDEFSDVSITTTEDKELSNWKVKDD